MDLITALQDKENRLRVSNGVRWMCGDGDGGWVVYERKPHQKHTRILIDTDDEDEALDVLLEIVK